MLASDSPAARQADAPAAIAAAALPWLSIRRRNDTALVLARTSASHASASIAAAPEATAPVRTGLLEEKAGLDLPHAIRDKTVTSSVDGSEQGSNGGRAKEWTSE